MYDLELSIIDNNIHKNMDLLIAIIVATFALAFKPPQLVRPD